MRRKVPWQRINESSSADWDLNQAAVVRRRNQYGTNDIAGIKINFWYELVLNTISDPMIWFLLITSILFAFLKNYQEAIVLGLAIIPLVGMDLFLHWRTQTSTQSLSSRLATFATVIRAGKKLEIPAFELVPGDLVQLKAGMPIPADGLILSGSHIQIEESSLTGESMPVSKKNLVSLVVEHKEQPLDYDYWAFAGTKLLTGEGLLRVIYTGKETLYGQIVSSALETSKDKTPLQQSINNLVFNLILFASGICVFLALVRLFQGFGLIDALLSAVTLAVAALPDEFPVVFTIFLGVGVYRLAIKKALVRRAVSVENLGRVTVICSDKTGTITEGTFTIAQSIPVEGMSKEKLLYLASLASREESFDLLDVTIMNEANKQPQISGSRIHTFPFTEGRKRETSVIADEEGQWLVVTKGAPETILALSTLNNAEQEYWQKKIAELAAYSYKVIACATIKMDKMEHIVEPEKAYEWSGLIAFADPVRAGVKEAVAQCLAANIHVLMITGDHPDTATAIANEIGLGEGNPNVVLIDDLEKYLSEATKNSLLSIDVIARAIPAQKLGVVQSLQRAGEIVAVTGDGVNDVPALKAADVGIAMGERGTQSAREVSDIVLLDDNFDSIVGAISEGRQLFKNLKVCFKYLLMIHFPFVFSAALIPLLGYPLPFYPIHIVFIELIIHPTAMIVFQELPITNTLEPIAKETQFHFFSTKQWANIVYFGLVTTSMITITFVTALRSGVEANYARALILAILSWMSIAITLSLSSYRFKMTRAVTSMIALCTLLFIQVPFFSQWFACMPLAVSSWMLVFSFAFLSWLMVQSGKQV